MKHPKQLVTVLLMGAACTMQAQRSEALLEKNWKFSKGDFKEASQPEFNDTKWESVVIPHDWAIFGPFDMNNDLQNVAVTQNFEKKASLKTGRTGGLPYVGTGWYRTSFDAPADKEVTLLFDGAMSEARVYINGKEACFWPFGYNSFHCNVTSLLNKDGKNNTLAVRLENRPQSSRWYPGAGLYRNVHLIVTDKIHVPVWGTQITTPHVNKDFAAVRLQTKIDNAGEKTAIRVETEILSPEGKVVTRKENTSRINHGQPFEQNFIVNAPELWSPESPSLYKAVSKIYADDKLVDTYTTRFGIRSIEYIADKGFYLNGKHRKFQGVCNHHDLGPLGAAINVAALRHQLTLLKDMGCDAIRTSHNMPTPELVALCDEMGFMMMIEPFDEWDIAKCENGYHRYFDEWAERDMINMLHNYRNNPCVIMWSIGNEVPTQCSPVGYKVAKFLQDICHREDPTRPVTCGMDQVSCVLANGFAAMIDIPGLNYRTQRYQESYDQLPQNLILGSETFCKDAYSFWEIAKKNKRIIGDFVWAGWDYIGEVGDGAAEYSDYKFEDPATRMTGGNGRIDLNGKPRAEAAYTRVAFERETGPFIAVDPVYQKEKLRLTGWQLTKALESWAWDGCNGEPAKVEVYARAAQVELFINGKSAGKKKVKKCRANFNITYQNGEITAVSYDENGREINRYSLHTAGKETVLQVRPEEKTVKPEGLAFIQLQYTDSKGIWKPMEKHNIKVTVENGVLKGLGSPAPYVKGNYTDHTVATYYGEAMAVVQADGNGPVKVTVADEERFYVVEIPCE